MNSIQDILNAFRKVLNKAKTFDEMQANAEKFLLTTLTEFERETEQKVIEKILGKWNSIRPTDLEQLAKFYSFLLELEKEKQR